jgi:hypothetical protein
VVWRALGGGDTVIVSADSNPPIPDGGTPSVLGTYQGAAQPSKCGDQLVMKVQFVSGTTPFMEFFAGLSIP